MRYINFHKHTHYSNIKTPDSITFPEQYMERAVPLGHKEYVTTEHGFQGNIYEAYALCEKYGLKCIYGVEAYYVDDVNDKSSRTNYHIVLIAMTEKARREINSMLSAASKEGFYYKPRIDLNMLLSLTPAETVVTTACAASRMFKSKTKIREINGVIQKYEDENSWESDFLVPVYKHFGKNLYLEVQAHNSLTQIEYNKKILDTSRKYGINIIHANDSHYIYPEDSQYRDMFLKGKDIDYPEEDGVILDYPDYETVVERYRQQGVLSEAQARQALDNTLIFDNSTGITLDKEFKIPRITKESGNKELKRLINTAWKKEKQHIPKELHQYYEREIRYEYKIVEDCGMADYFVLDHYIVKKAKEEYGAILTRTGRGSAVSFYINKLLGLTEVDRISAPITLYPTRFMSAERILNSRSLPDIDLNFADVKPVIKASKDYLGEDGVYYMIAYKPLQKSSAFRLWCKAKGMPVSEYNEVAKNLESFENDPKWSGLIKESERFQGVIESVAPSPCSFLLSNDKISEMVGLVRVGEEICCCLDGYNCDVYKFLKNDYLTVTVWSIIEQVYSMIGRPIDDIQTLFANCDDKVWELYAKGLTTTINQADSDYDKQILKRYKPRSIEELSAYVAAIRPGFASLLDNFIERKPYSTGVEELDTILEDSFHYMLYQESIMKYLVWLGIEEKGTYDIIKKISKKKFTEAELEKLKEQLLEGWIKNTGKEDGFDGTWKVVEDAAKYSFNACVSGDTKIQMPENEPYSNLSVEELYDVINKDKTNTVIALSMYDDNKIRENEIVDIRYNGEKEIYRVCTESGEYIDCTMNHKFPTPYGKKRLDELAIGDDLYVADGENTAISKIKSIDYLRVDKTYDIEMKAPAHTFVSESGLVTSNSHALSVAIDSLYGAYLKSHYPLEYFTVALSKYTGDTSRTSKLIEELNYFNISLHPIRFRYSKADYNMDRDNNSIYKGISSVKYLSDDTAEMLYQMKDMRFDSFIDFLKINPCDKRQTEILIMLDFFSEFGNRTKLMHIYNVYEQYGSRKEIFIKDCPIDEVQMEKCSTKTAKKYKITNCRQFVSLLCKALPPKKITINDVINAEKEYLGYINYINKNKKNELYVLGTNTKYSPVIIGYRLDTGEMKKYKISKQHYQNEPIEEGDTIKIYFTENKPKSKKMPDGTWTKSATEYDDWITSYVKCTG